MCTADAQSVEDALRAELLDGDRIIAGAPAVLRAMLAGHDETLFNAQIVAHVRALAASIAGQLLAAQAEAAGEHAAVSPTSHRDEELQRKLLEDSNFLTHLHALALEFQLIEQLEMHGGIDPVMSPLVQDQTASPYVERAALGRAFLTAQARFMQQMRKMEHPLHELPDELFDGAVRLLNRHMKEGDGNAREAKRALRAGHEPHTTRLSLAERLLRSLEPGDGRGLRIDQAGLSLFISALALAGNRDRGLVTLSLGTGQVMRLALSLRAAGLDDAAIQAQFLILHPRSGSPDGFGAIAPDDAAALLDRSMARALD